MNQEKSPSESAKQEKEYTQKNSILNESQANSTKNVIEVKADKVDKDDWDDWYPHYSH